jgi:YjzC-like protein
MQGASKSERIFKSGEEAPESGVYTVIHAGHRPEHSATIFKGERFPPCVQCGPQVRFRLTRPAALISEDFDFRQ